MKQSLLFSVIALQTALSAVCGSSLPVLSDFADLTGRITAEPVFVENFESAPARWSLPQGFAHAPHEGRNGSGALCYTRSNPANFSMALTMIRGLNPNLKYRLSVDYRTDLKFDEARNIMEIFAVTFMKNGQRLNSAFHMKKQQNAKDWETMTMTFQPHPDTEITRLALLMRAKRTGRIWFDNIRIIATENRNGFFYLTKPHMLALNSDKAIEFRVLAGKGIPESDLAVMLHTRTPQLLRVQNGIASGSLQTAGAGQLSFQADLLNLPRKEILARRNILLTCRQSAAAPSGAVTIDDRGFFQIDGKPFLPVGLFLGFLDQKKDPHALQRISEAGFNMVQSIGTGTPHFFFAGQKATRRESMLASLDLLQAHGLKYIFAIKYQIPSLRHLQKFDHVSGLRNVNEYIISAVKNHPALFGWYVSDENPVDQLPEILALRQQISSLDPHHPVLTLTDKKEDFVPFAATGDALLADIYPIGRSIDNIGPGQSMTDVRNHLLAARRGGIPVWLVPQIFAWASFQKNRPVPRYPTAEEIRSMVLQGTIRGIQGYLFYAYHPIFYYSEKLDPGKSQEQWCNVVPSVRLLRELTPFILSREQPPPVRVRQIRGSLVEARAFRCRSRLRVIITGLGPGQTEAVLEIRGVPHLTSRFGHTVGIGNEQYLFKGDNICSDVLEAPLQFEN